MRLYTVVVVLLLIALVYRIALGSLIAIPAPPQLSQSAADEPGLTAHLPLQTIDQTLAGSTQADPRAEDYAGLTIDARLLVIAASDQEPSLQAIRQALDYLGTPYTLWIAPRHAGALTADRLSRGKHGFYQGVMLASGSLGRVGDEDAALGSTLSDAEWLALQGYEAAFGIRQATWYTFPTEDYGFQPSVGLNTTPPSPGLDTRLTVAGRAVFSYLNPASPITIRDAYTFLAAPADHRTTPLLVDARGNALVAIHLGADGREDLALTFEQRPDLLHTLALSYGVVNWVTRGLFLGERHVYLDAQVDDFFIPDDIWLANTPCGSSETDTGATYRLSGDDLLAVIAWQHAKQREPLSPQLRLELAFNGFGTTGIFSRDTLTPVARQYQHEFRWVNHTLDHTNLDHVGYAAATTLIQQNDDVAADLGLAAYEPASMVTPEISGLANQQFLQAAHDVGIRYLVSDDSLPGYNNPSPNAGIYNRYQPEILMIPRHASTLGFNVSTPEQWVAAYRCLHAAPPSGASGADAYRQLLDEESDDLLAYLLRGDLDPMMFHQANLRAYDGSRSLLGDLLDATLAKYNRSFTLPILSPGMGEIGRRMASRMRYDTAGVAATIAPGRSIVLSAARSATVPITGVCLAGAERYGGQPIAYVALEAGQRLTLPLQRPCQ